ncbi:hypothetical protein BDK51DRAFT_44771 [Blyttiomyces helicus]|uniref:Uncharacterized protein n=1 Tax=Blyttiomyces helicus TaxID=388810 RepID=A0A4V1IRM3_9FUNG|nr:hypothetical protein BDK51DRAFT_44771 [Blyttiomyces helicus]|eukprot:RKO90557.1 hypothetical protein BDK51DRAFT_44771 [Blyttiomyces helicus]
MPEPEPSEDRGLRPSAPDGGDLLVEPDTSMDAAFEMCKELLAVGYVWVNQTGVALKLPSTICGRISVVFTVRCEENGLKPVTSSFLACPASPQAVAFARDFNINFLRTCGTRGEMALSVKRGRGKRAGAAGKSEGQKLSFQNAGRSGLRSLNGWESSKRSASNQSQGKLGQTGGIWHLSYLPLRVTSIPFADPSPFFGPVYGGCPGSWPREMRIVAVLLSSSALSLPSPPALKPPIDLFASIVRNKPEESLNDIRLLGSAVESGQCTVFVAAWTHSTVVVKRPKFTKLNEKELKKFCS